jgi:flagellar biosynthesis/type III secretory pathway protein FliH
MAIIRSIPVAGQATTLAAASAERSRLAALEQTDRLRAEGRAEAERAWQPRVEAAERRAREAEARADERVKQAQAQLEDRLGRAAAALEAALRNLSALERQVVEAAEGEAVRLALAVSQRILAREVASDPAWMRDSLAAALAEVPDRRRVTVLCAPRDAAAIRERLAAATAAVPGTESLLLAEDPALQPGSLVLSAGGTRLDASVHASWERTAAALLAAVPRPPLAMRDDGGVPEAQP